MLLEVSVHPILTRLSSSSKLLHRCMMWLVQFHKFFFVMILDEFFMLHQIYISRREENSSNFLFKILLNKHLLIVKGFAMHSNSSKVGRPSKLMENFAKKSWVCLETVLYHYHPFLGQIINPLRKCKKVVNFVTIRKKNYLPSNFDPY